MKDGSTITDEINVADAHPAGKRPFGRKEYIKKFKTLTQGLITQKEAKRFLKAAQNLTKLKAKDLSALNIQILKNKKIKAKNKAIFV